MDFWNSRQQQLARARARRQPSWVMAVTRASSRLRDPSLAPPHFRTSFRADPVARIRQWRSEVRRSSTINVRAQFPYLQKRPGIDLRTWTPRAVPYLTPSVVVIARREFWDHWEKWIAHYQRHRGALRVKEYLWHPHAPLFARKHGQKLSQGFPMHTSTPRNGPLSRMDAIAKRLILPTRRNTPALPMESFGAIVNRFLRPTRRKTPALNPLESFAQIQAQLQWALQEQQLQQPQYPQGLPPNQAFPLFAPVPPSRPMGEPTGALAAVLRATGK
jgi:hypothetical protein